MLYRYIHTHTHTRTLASFLMDILFGRFFQHIHTHQEARMCIHALAGTRVSRSSGRSQPRARHSRMRALPARELSLPRACTRALSRARHADQSTLARAAAPEFLLARNSARTHAGIYLLHATHSWYNIVMRRLAAFPDLSEGDTGTFFFFHGDVMNFLAAEWSGRACSAPIVSLRTFTALSPSIIVSLCVACCRCFLWEQ